MRYTIRFTKRALKDLKGINQKDRQRILYWIKANLAKSDDPFSASHAKKLKNRVNLWRWRIGKYRIIAHVFDDEIVIEVLRIGHRSSVYDNLPR